MERVFNDNIKFIDLFAGMGGFHIAMSKYNSKCVFASEIDKHAMATYTYNHLRNEGSKKTLYGDITKVDEDKIPIHDILCAGFPCQPFSISGKQLGFNDTRGTMFFEIIRIVRRHNPKILFLENVSNLKGHAGGETLENMKILLKELGYDVFYEVLNASDFGVPQARKRIYFVAFRSDLNVSCFNFPKSIQKKVNLEDIIEDEILVDSKLYIDREDIFMKSEEDIDSLESKNTNKPIRVGTINKGGQGERIYSIKGHAITLSAEGGGPGARTGAYFIDNRVRRLTIKEGLRAQGYPEWFEFPNTIPETAKYKQLGNSVAIPVLEEIVKNICTLEELKDITHIKEVDEESIDLKLFTKIDVKEDISQIKFDV